MCGIFGFHLRSPVRKDWQKLFEELAIISESRGKEACGVAIRHHGKLDVLRSSKPIRHLLKQPAYRQLMRTVAANDQDLALIGHTRLVTNGSHQIIANNQPVMRDGLVLIHNGIICNYAQLWRERLHREPPSELDSEVLAALLAKELTTKDIGEAIHSLFDAIEGDASIAVLSEASSSLILASNTGSLYYTRAQDGSLAFASEYSFLSKIRKRYPEFGEIVHIKPREHRVIEMVQSVPATIHDHSQIHKKHRELQRCTNCILPETFPGITFDHAGVCNFCRDDVPFVAKGNEALKTLCDQYRRDDGKPDCLVAFSGGRDSSYALHYLVKEMGMHPITFTYDWGMVTDLARRNIARMCGKLGVENILISADIPKKREHIRLNVEAWLRKPELGMVTLFMAGDKEFFYHPGQIRKDLGIELTFFASNRLEQTSFKSGFCGVKESNSWYLYLSWGKKLGMVRYFLTQYLRNPRYINRSLLDTLFSFYCAYVLKNDFHVFYDYIPWDESVIENTLKHEYNWETESHDGSTWRIGDGTAAFYNYIYHTMAGFTEHDTFRSAQIRSGLITREEALVKIAIDNQARMEAMRVYASTVGFDLDRALTIIDAAPRLY